MHSIYVELHKHITSL